MEHRWYKRKSVGFEMMAKCRTLDPIRGRVLNISRGGILFETGAVSLEPNSTVELSCRLLIKGEWHSYRIHAQVVYVAKGCAGLIFLDNEAAYREFEAVLESVVSPQHSKKVLNEEHLSDSPLRDYLLHQSEGIAVALSSDAVR